MATQLEDCRRRPNGRCPEGRGPRRMGGAAGDRPKPHVGAEGASIVPAVAGLAFPDCWGTCRLIDVRMTRGQETPPTARERGRGAPSRAHVPGTSRRAARPPARPQPARSRVLAYPARKAAGASESRPCRMPPPRCSRLHRLECRNRGTQGRRPPRRATWFGMLASSVAQTDPPKPRAAPAPRRHHHAEPPTGCVKRAAEWPVPNSVERGRTRPA
jgi:hypothetical protein